LIALTDHLNGPVVVAIAASGPLRATVNMVIGQCDGGALVATKDVVLSTEERGLGLLVILLVT
jgi:hypothetical protein